MTHRPGFALLLSLALVLSLSLLGLGMVAAGGREVRIGQVVQQRVEARAAAESGARAAFHAWSTSQLHGLSVGEARPVPAAWLKDLDARGTPRAVGQLEVEVERIDSVLYLIRAQATVGSPTVSGATGRAALLARTINPSWLASTFPAAVVARAAHLERGSVLGSDACAEPADGVPGLWAEEVVQEPEFNLSGAPASIASLAPSPVDEAPLDLPLVQHLADLHEEVGRLRPAPRADAGRCAPGSGNWGALAPADACHRHRPLILAAGPLQVEGGQGRGLLVVDGDLLLEGSFRFEGVVRVHGTLRMADGVIIRGAVRADSIHVAGGTVHYDGCVAASMAAAPALDRAFRPRSGWWVPTF